MLRMERLAKELIVTAQRIRGDAHSQRSEGDRYANEFAAHE